MNYSLLSKLHPNLQLLLKKISVIENVDLYALIEQIDLHREKEIRLELAICVFCASYFAQSSTLHGHEAARHGQGYESIKSVSDSLTLGTSLSSACNTSPSANDYIISSH